METGIVRRFNRVLVVAAKRIGKVQNMWVELRQIAPRALKVEQNNVVAAAQ